jgi:hypothetical protein
MCPETICEIQLKQYIYNKRSKYYPGDSKHDSASLIMDHCITSGAVAAADNLISIHNVMTEYLFNVNRTCIHK